jgi:hypothetical protein
MTKFSPVLLIAATLSLGALSAPAQARPIGPLVAQCTYEDAAGTQTLQFDVSDPSQNYGMFAELISERFGRFFVSDYGTQVQLYSQAKGAQAYTEISSADFSSGRALRLAVYASDTWLQCVVQKLVAQRFN